MPEKPLPFIITDRRKFNPDGEARHDEPKSPPAPETPPSPTTPPTTPDPDPENVNTTPGTTQPDTVSSAEETELDAALEGEEVPTAPTAEQMEQSRLAFQATADRLDTAIRAANPSVEHPPAMTFDQLVQSVYMQAILQLGGGTQQGQQPQIDILGARQSIEMLGILDEKTRGNLSEPEHILLSSALFELRLGFLEITQALARSAQQRGAAAPQPVPGGPRIVR
jgi:hypothetical protein